MTKQHPLTTGNLPPKGRKLIVRGTYLGGSATPVNDGDPRGGALVTYHGLTKGTPTFYGRTADPIFVNKSDQVTWELA